MLTDSAASSCDSLDKILDGNHGDHGYINSGCQGNIGSANHDNKSQEESGVSHKDVNMQGNNDLKTVSSTNNTTDIKTSIDVINSKQNSDVNQTEQSSDCVSRDKTQRILPDTPSSAHKQGVPALAGKAPKPLILRPKPKFLAARRNINSFTAEDIDICQSKFFSSSFC
jgi:hypothetical protein